MISCMTGLPGMFSLTDSGAGEHLWPRALRDTASLVTPSPAEQEVSAGAVWAPC